MEKDRIKIQIKQGSKRQGGAQSIRRTIAILRSVFKYNETDTRLSKIAKDVDIPFPGVHGILAGFPEENFLSFGAAKKQYHLGTELYWIGSVTRQFSIRDRFYTTLKRKKSCHANLSN